MMRYERVSTRESPHPTRVPLVALHGFLGAPASFAGLDLGGDVALGWLPGHGRAPWTPDGASFVDVASAMLRAMPFDEPVVLVGYSMGGRLALTMAMLEPARFAHVIVVGANPGLIDANERAERVAWDDAQAERLLRDGLPSFVDAWEMLPLFATQRSLAPDRLDAQRRTRLDHTERGLAFAMRALGLGRMPAVDIARLRCPVTAVAGALDARYAEIAERIGREAPHGSCRIVPEVGHNVVLEARESLARLVRSVAEPGETTRECAHG